MSRWAPLQKESSREYPLICAVGWGWVCHWYWMLFTLCEGSLCRTTQPTVHWVGCEMWGRVVAALFSWMGAVFSLWEERLDAEVQKMFWKPQCGASLKVLLLVGSSLWKLSLELTALPHFLLPHRPASQALWAKKRLGHSDQVHRAEVMQSFSCSRMAGWWMWWGASSFYKYSRPCRNETVPFSQHHSGQNCNLHQSHCLHHSFCKIRYSHGRSKIPKKHSECRILQNYAVCCLLSAAGRFFWKICKLISVMQMSF